MRPARSDSPSSLHTERLERIVAALRESAASSVLDLGCGPGELLVLLAAEEQFCRIVGIDTDQEVLQEARHHLAAQGHSVDGGRLSLFHASFTDFIPELAGFDAITLVETIEHVAPVRLSAIEKTVFAGYRSRTVLITTPNSEYNVLHGMASGQLRHPDPYFEWTREKFRRWATGVAGRHGYQVDFCAIGEVDPRLGGSTQMAIFRRF